MPGDRVTQDELVGSDRYRRAANRFLAFAVGLALVLATVMAASRMSVDDLTIVLLIVLVEVLAVATLSGPGLAVAAAVVAVFLVNWYLVPPFQTFEVANPDNVVALVVFVAVAVAASVLMELNGRARSRAARSAEEAELLGDVVSLEVDVDPASSLERIRDALGMERVVLSQVRGADEATLLQVGRKSRDEAAALRAELGDDYRLTGFGPPRMAIDPTFLSALGAAAVRAYEGQLLDQEQRRAAELAAIDRARTALLASVSHDLRTPLAALRVAVDTLREPGAGLAGTDRDELLGTIDESAARLDELISNLLDMGRLEAGAVVARLEPTAVEEVVARALIGLPGHGVDLDVDDSLPLVSTDPVLLERMVSNLVSNARRHGGPNQRVLVRAVDEGDVVAIEVVDHGPGIEPVEREKVFEPFRQLGDRTDMGTGLGLAIVRGFAGAVGCGVALMDTPGGGLTARLQISVAHPDRAVTP